MMEKSTKFTIELEREEDGRWIAEVQELSGVMAYGSSSEEAMARVQALALRVLTDRLEHGEASPCAARWRQARWASQRSRGMRYGRPW